MSIAAWQEPWHLCCGETRSRSSLSFQFPCHSCSVGNQSSRTFIPMTAWELCVHSPKIGTCDVQKQPPQKGICAEASNPGLCKHSRQQDARNKIGLRFDASPSVPGTPCIAVPRIYTAYHTGAQNLGGFYFLDRSFGLGIRGACQLRPAFLWARPCRSRLGCPTAWVV